MEQWVGGLVANWVQPQVGVGWGGVGGMEGGGWVRGDKCA